MLFKDPFGQVCPPMKRNKAFLFLTGAQEHFYLETQTSLVVPGEGEEVTVFASTQNPTLTQVIDAGCQNTIPNTSLDSP